MDQIPGIRTSFIILTTAAIIGDAINIYAPSKKWFTPH